MNQIKVVCAIIFNERNKILCCKRSIHMNHPLMWEFPGGKVEPGESFEDALIREILEELNITISSPQYFDTYLIEDKNIELTAFTCDIIKEGKINLVEHETFIWLPINQLETLNWLSADLQFISKLKYNSN